MGIYPTKDGWLGVSVLTPAQWHSFCELIGIAELALLPEYQVTLGRLADADAIEAEMCPALLRRSAREWFDEGQARRIPLALVPTMQELFEGEQMRARGSHRTITHPDHGELTVPAAPFRLQRSPARSGGRVARPGEHGPRPEPTRPGTGRPLARASTLKLSPNDQRPQLLKGVRVLDLSMGWAGPLAARHLADAGAEVIKIESRQHFDWWRGWEATPESLAAHMHEKANAFNIMNRNKFDITLDLGHRRGCEIFRELVAVSDVVLENYSAGVLPKLGLDWPALSAINPRLVMLSMPPFGAGGPWHGHRAYGSTVEQASGLPHLQGGPGDPPIMQHVALGDPVAGVHGAAAVLTALLHQQRSGQGQFLDLSQVESVTHLGLHGIAHQVVTGGPAPRTGNRHPVHAPQGVYRAAGDDEWLMLTVESESAWRGLTQCLGCEELRAAEFNAVEVRHANHDAIDRQIEAWSSSRPRDEAVAALESAGVIAAPVFTAREVLDHPQLVARGFWTTLDRAHVGPIAHPVAPYRLGAAPPAIASVAPTLGEHSRLVLGTLLALSAAELDDLEAAGVIGEEPALAVSASAP
jgi:crotonobetainyl-CoA:carnitine CoA-transferase CaiB-like acyl-CoA transferase